MKHHMGTVRITPRFLLDIIKKSSDLPSDAKIRGVGYDIDRDCFYMMLMHSSFPPTDEGDLLPVIVPTLTG